MTYKELKEFLSTLTEEQLDQPAVVFEDDDENGKLIDSWEISKEDNYWEHHGDCIGSMKEVEEYLKQEHHDDLDELIKVPAGTVTLQLI